MTMTVNIRDLKLKKTNIFEQARSIQEKADTEKRKLTQDEQNSWDAIMNDWTDLKSDIDRRERLEAMETEVESRETSNRPDPEDEGGAPETRMLEQVDVRYRDVVAQMLRNGAGNREQRARVDAFLRGNPVPVERRDLQSNIDPQGGYITPPPQFVAGLLKAVDNILYFRQPGWATVIPLASSEGYEASLDADPDDGQWTTEIGSHSLDTAMKFGRRKLEPHPLKKGILVSKKLLRLAPSAENLVIDRFRYKFGVTMEKGYMTGTGANQPLGVFTASANGISTGRDVSTDNSSTAPTFDGLTNAKYTLKPQYWPSAKWMFHRDVLKVVAKIKNAVTGDYIWRESVRAGEPDRILNLPTFMSEYAPNTLTTGLYVGILGDFSYYHIADSLTMEMQRLVEKYADTSQIGFYADLESDGMPVLEEAFVRVKLA
jgi:HK97 family phage major capsid protein